MSPVRVIFGTARYDYALCCAVLRCAFIQACRRRRALIMRCVAMCFHVSAGPPSRINHALCGAVVSSKRAVAACALFDYALRVALYLFNYAPRAALYFIMRREPRAAALYLILRPDLSPLLCYNECFQIDVM